MIIGKDLRRALHKSKTTISELAHICRQLSATITPDNFVMSEESGSTNSIFADSTPVRTIESWVAKIAYDFYAKKKGSEVRAFKVGEIIDFKIREFAANEKNLSNVQILIKRKLNNDDVIRLLWVGDQGCLFAQKFMLLFATYLEQSGNQEPISLISPSDDDD